MANGYRPCFLKERHEYRGYIIEVRNEDKYIVEIRDKQVDFHVIAESAWFSKEETVPWAMKYIDTLKKNPGYCPKCGYQIVPNEGAERERR